MRLPLTMFSDGRRIVVLSGIHRLRRNIILRQPWKEIRMEGLACMARDHSQFCHPVIAMYVNIPEDIILKLERFIVLVYCRTSDDMHVDTTWMTLFSQMSCNIENIPPTQAASDQHIKSSSYQSGHLWGQSLNFQTILIGDGRHPKLPVIFRN